MLKFRLFAIYTLFSLIFFAQVNKVEIKPQSNTDSLALKNFSISPEPKIVFNNLDSKNKRTLYFIPNAKPKDSTLYSSLKGKVRNDSIYKIPNAILPKIIAKK